MTQYKKSRRSHIRWDRLAIIMAGIIVIVAGIFVGIKMLATNPYSFSYFLHYIRHLSN